MPDVRYVDVTGDKIPDALVVGSCPSSTSGNPARVAVFSGSAPAGQLKEVGRIPTGPHDYFASMTVAVSGSTITLDGSAYGPNDPLCCPGTHMTLTYQLRNGRFVETGRIVKRQAGG